MFFSRWRCERSFLDGGADVPFGVLFGLELDKSEDDKNVRTPDDKPRSSEPKFKIGDKIVIKVRGEYRGCVGIIDSSCGSFWRIRLHDDSNPNWKTTGKLIRKKETSLTLC